MKAFQIASTTLLLLLLFAASCTSPSLTQTIQTQYDNATDTKNFRWNHRLHEFRWRSPLVYLDQSFLKQLDGNEVAQYRLYDIVVLRANEFRLEDKMFMLLDEKPITLEPQKREDDLIEKQDDVLNPESRDIFRVTRLEYVLSPGVVTQIQNAASIQFRYYSGSDIITVSFPPEKVLRLKELMAST